MFVKKNKSRNGRIILTFTHGYRDENGKTKHINVETIGYLDELEKQYDDPIPHFKSLGKEKYKDFSIDEYFKEQKGQQSIVVPLGTKLSESDNLGRKNLGYLVFSKLFHHIGLASVFKNYQKTQLCEYDILSIFQLLLFSRLLFPGSKKKTHEDRNQFFDDWDFSLKDMYRSLDHFDKLKMQVQKAIWENTKDLYNRDASTSYYDCTNYYFEITYNDEDLIDEEGNIIIKGYRKKGPSKEHRKTPIVQLGLFMDNKGIPLSYKLFPGNESEKTALRPALKETKRQFGIEKTIVVADRGLNTSDNIFFIAGVNDDEHKEHDGYVYGQSVLGADKEFKKWVLEQEDYQTSPIYNDDGSAKTYKEKIYDENGNIIKVVEKNAMFKHKSRVVAKQLKIKRDGKRKSNVNVYQKQMVYYSRQYAVKQKYDREKLIRKAKDLIANPGKYTKSTSYGAAGLIKDIRFDKETGEVLSKKIELDIEKIKEAEKYDGYYSIVTSEKHLSDEEIRNIYKGLWKIEESFKITKSQLRTRPAHVWTPEHIEGHFLTCFVSLVMIRLLECDIKGKYSTRQIIESLRKLGCSHIQDGYYMLDHWDEIIRDLGEKYGIDYDHKILSKKEIKRMMKNN